MVLRPALFVTPVQQNAPVTMAGNGGEVLRGFEERSYWMFSEATLFKRFKTKQALFEAALDVDDLQPTWPQRLRDAVGRNTPRENLTAALLALSERLRVAVPRMMVLRTAGTNWLGRLPLEQVPPIRDEQTFAAYFEAEAKLGRLQMLHPRLQANQIIAALIHYFDMQDLAGYQPSDLKEYVEALVNVHIPANL